MLWNFLALLTLCSGTALAQEATGLFGIPLGAPCEVCETPLNTSQDALQDAVSLAEGLVPYLVQPPEPDPRFELYQVRTAKKGGAVVDVSGVALFEEEAKARAAFAGLREAYATRLGAPEARELYRAARCVFRPRKGNTVVTLLLREDMLERRWVIYVNAMDRKAFAKAGKSK